MLLQVLSIFLCCSCVSVISDVIFSGFTKGGTYYTNGDNITQLTCNAEYDGVILTNLTWINKTNSGDVDTGRSVIMFEEVVQGAKWGSTMMYYCRAYYQNNTLNDDSNNITVIVQYNTTVTINYSTTHISFSSYSQNKIAISVMTQNVELRCGVESATWNSQTFQNHPNPLTLELLTIQYRIELFCKDSESRFVRSVFIIPIGSGIWLQNGSSYTELSEGEVITLNEDIRLVCVTSVTTGPSWYFRGASNTGNGEKLDNTSNTEYDSKRGFLTLTLSQHIYANRTGYYYCATNERIDAALNTRYIEHSVQVLHMVTTTAPTPTTSMQVTTFQSTSTLPTSNIRTPTTALTTEVPVTTQVMPTQPTPIHTSSVTTQTTTSNTEIPEVISSQTSAIHSSSTTSTILPSLDSIEETNRPNATGFIPTDYFHTTTTTPTTQPNIDIQKIIIPVIASLAVLILSLALLTVLLIILIVWRRKKKRRSKPVYTKAVERLPSLEFSDPTPYATLSNGDDNTNSMKPTVKTTKYEKLQTADSSADHVEMSDLNSLYIPIDEIRKRKCDMPSEAKDTDYLNIDVNSLNSSEKYGNNPYATLVPLTDYKRHLSSLLMNGQLEIEYGHLGGHALRYDCSAASDTKNEGKNKYRLIYPYDSSRVTLSGETTGSDYINASFIPGFHVPDHFIAAQAPKTGTLPEFWQMIWEQNVTIIVMLTRVVELGKEKSATYWPEHVGSSETYGNITVLLQKEERCKGYMVRELIVKVDTKKPIKATQYHFTAWPDHDVPQLYNGLLEFTHLVKRCVKDVKFPMLVHCSAGVGRSGTFIALYNLMEAVSREEPVSVYRLVDEMREHRPQMVQTLSQYRFIHLALLELILGSTAIPLEEFTDTYNHFSQSQEDNVLHEQFQELCFQSDNSFTYPATAATLPQNLDKNPVEDVVPYDDKRVILYSPHWDCEYINASYVGGYELIAAPLPTARCLSEFLQLIFQLEDPLVVLLVSDGEWREWHEDTNRDTHRACYWLEETGIKNYEEFTVLTEKSHKSKFLIQQKMVISSKHDQEEHSFTQFISLAWENGRSDIEAEAILNLLDQITLQKQNNLGKKLLFCCSDGIGNTGVLLTVHRAIADIKSGGSVDVFQIVKQLRNSRRNMVPTFEHYLSCYSLINKYCQMN